MTAACSIFFHNYYGSHKYWMDFFEKNTSFTANLYYNTAEDSLYNTEPAEKDFLNRYQPSPGGNIKKIIRRQSPNQGKDIGGKLVLLDAFQKLKIPTEYGLFLHDKKSPYKVNNTDWADNLLKTVTPAFSEKALRIFADQPNAGIITASGNTMDEYDYGTNAFRSNNKSLLPRLQEQFAIKPAVFQYATGTMFWFRMKPIDLFFQQYDPLKIRAMLEKGNITDEYAGSYTHSWERLLCWIITGQNYTIKTI